MWSFRNKTIYEFWVQPDAYYPMMIVIAVCKSCTTTDTNYNMKHEGWIWDWDFTFNPRCCPAPPLYCVLWFSLWVNDYQRNISLCVVLNCSNIFNKICLFNIPEQIASNILPAQSMIWFLPSAKLKSTIWSQPYVSYLSLIINTLTQTITSMKLTSKTRKQNSLHNFLTHFLWCFFRYWLFLLFVV